MLEVSLKKIPASFDGFMNWEQWIGLTEAAHYTLEATN